MVDNRTNYSKDISNLIRESYGGKLKVYKTDIPRSVRAEEISAEGHSIFQHDPKGKVADAYRVLTKEVLNNAENIPTIWISLLCPFVFNDTVSPICIVFCEL